MTARGPSRATFTAVIPTYNRRSYVGDALRSILDQADGPDEIVVIDDGSTDGTDEWLNAEFGERVRVLRQQNAGVSAARRAGVEAATGDWIAFLDSDDQWTPGRMQLFRAAVAALPDDVPWVFGDTRLVSDEGDTKTLFELHGLKVDSEVQLLPDALPTQFPFQFSLLQSSIIRREALLAADGFAENLRSSEDFLVSFLMALNHRFAAIPQVVVRLNRTSDLATSSLDLQGRGSVDYHRARAIAFGEAARSRRGGKWRRLHEESVRGWCEALGAQDATLGSLPWLQFRYGVSLKALAFTGLATMFGRAGTRYWGELRRTFERPARAKGAGASQRSWSAGAT